MRNRLIASVALFSLVSPMALPALADSATKGNVESLSGQVLVRGESESWKSLEGAELAPGDSVRTGNDGQAIFRFGENRVRVAANTELKVVSIDPKGSEISLERGRILGKADTSLVVSTSKTSAKATAGEFVLETSASGSALRVLSGNARLDATQNESVTFGGVSQVPDAADQATLVSVGKLSNIQSVGEVALLGEWKTKGKGARVRNTEETVGGDRDASPDQDVAPPRQPDPPVVENPPVQPPQPPAQPPTPPTQPVAPAVAKAGFPVWGVVGGILLVGGIVALVAGNDDDNENVFVPSNPGVPSPSSN